MTPEQAYKEVHKSLKSGLLIRPDSCSECGVHDPRGSDGRTLIHAHHHAGYDRPLDVQWLCSACHGKEDSGASGEKNYKSKLNRCDVRYIRENYKRTGHNNSNCLELAKKYGVDKVTIQRVVNKTSWGFDAALEEGKDDE